MKTVLVTGANRGIGLGLVREFLANTEVERIYATTRNIKKSTELLAIEDDRLQILEVDVVNDEQIKKAVDVISADSPTGIDLLINNAAILNKYAISGEEIDRTKLNEQFEVNCTSLFIIIQRMLPLLRLGASCQGSAWVVSIGSTGPSFPIEQPPALPYSMSKAALNMLTRVAAVELEKDGVRVMTMYPGYVHTDMGNLWGKTAPMTVDESVKAMISSLHKLGEEHNGGYFDYDLRPMPF